MGAIERLMRRSAAAVPRTLRALQLATDVTKRLPFLRRMHLALSGGGIGACDAQEAVGGGEWVWVSELPGPTEALRQPFQERKLVMYIHGGAFVLCSPATHRAITCNIARATGALVLAVTYRRPPDCSFPGALEDIIATYQRIVACFPPSRIIVAGESAGGNLTLSLCVHLAKAGLPLPSGIVLMCPWVDLADRSFTPWEEAKDYLHPELIEAFASAYVAGELVKQRQELVSPIYSTALGLLPPTLLIYGSAETLAPQNERFAKQLRAHGVQLTTYVGPDQVHAFPVYADVAYGDLGQAVVMASAAMSVSLLLLFAGFFWLVFAAIVGASRHFEIAVEMSCISVVILVIAKVVLLMAGTHNAHGSFYRDDESTTSLSSSGESACFDIEDEKPPGFECYRQLNLFSEQLWERSV